MNKPSHPVVLSALALAVSIGEELDPAARPFYVSGLGSTIELDPLFLVKLAAQLNVQTFPHEASQIESLFQAAMANDLATAKSVVEKIEAAGFGDAAKAAFAAINTLNEQLHRAWSPPSQYSDVVTSDDLPKLRTEMFGYAETAGFSEEMKSACRNAIIAIDQVLDGSATSDDLKRVLDNFVTVGRREVHLHDHSAIVGTC